MTRAAAEDAFPRLVTHAAIHHPVVVVEDLEELQDRRVEGDWPGLFDAPSRGLRAVFLGVMARPPASTGEELRSWTTNSRSW